MVGTLTLFPPYATLSDLILRSRAQRGVSKDEWHQRGLHGSRRR
jgi:hypothetical protein